jgi:hypothetical protein
VYVGIGHQVLDTRRTGDYCIIPQELCAGYCAVVSMIMELVLGIPGGFKQSHLWSIRRHLWYK